jgi:hypothetical protein
MMIQFQSMIMNLLREKHKWDKKSFWKFKINIHLQEVKVELIQSLKEKWFMFMKKKMIRILNKICHYLQMLERLKWDIIPARPLEPLAKNLHQSLQTNTLTITEKMKEVRTCIIKMINQRFWSLHKKIMISTLPKEELRIKTEQFIKMTNTTKTISVR